MNKSIKIPPSKSMMQRALIVASLSPGRSCIINPAICDDSVVLGRALESAGVKIVKENNCWLVKSSGKLTFPDTTLNMEGAGTGVRFFSSLSIITDGKVTIDGNNAMRSRPQQELTEMLKKCGVRVRFLSAEGRVPFVLEGKSARVPAQIELRSSTSSQHISGLMMVSPLLNRKIKIIVKGDVVSRPYISMTQRVMEKFGGKIEMVSDRCWISVPGRYHPARIEIEPDASSSAMLIAAEFISGKQFGIKKYVEKVAKNSSQGDWAFIDIVQKLYSDGPITLNMKDTPDIVPPTVACALFRKSPTHIYGISHLKAKESNRMEVLCNQLSLIGATLQATDSSISVYPSRLRGGVRVDPQDDHRMAMTFGLVSLRVADIRITNTGCVSKSYPNFFNDLEKFK